MLEGVVNGIYLKSTLTAIEKQVQFFIVFDGFYFSVKITSKGA